MMTAVVRDTVMLLGWNVSIVFAVSGQPVRHTTEKKKSIDTFSVVECLLESALVLLLHFLLKVKS